MNKPLGSYEFSRTELEMLKELAHSSTSISELARRIRKSQPTVTATIEKFQARGFVTVERRGMRKSVSVSETKHAQLLREIIRLLSDVEYSFFSLKPEELEPEDVVLHTLLINGVTNVTYALILIAKTKIVRNRLLSPAETLGLHGQVEAMLRFLDTHKVESCGEADEIEEQRGGSDGVRMLARRLGELIDFFSLLEISSVIEFSLA